MTNVIHKCGTCALYDPNTSTCPVLRMQVDPNEDFCSKHVSKVHICEACGRIDLKPILVPEGSAENTIYHTLCHNCLPNLNTCSFCQNWDTCPFETDPSPLPKTIQQQTQNGPVITVTTVKNPSRVEITCAKGCPCYDPENDCMKQFNYCERMDHIWNSTTL